MNNVSGLAAYFLTYKYTNIRDFVILKKNLYNVYEFDDRPAGEMAIESDYAIDMTRVRFPARKSIYERCLYLWFACKYMYFYVLIS